VSFNISRMFLSGFTMIGISTYFCSKNKKSHSPTKEESVATFTFISNSEEQRKQEKLKVNLMYPHEALLYTDEILPEGAVN